MGTGARKAPPRATKAARADRGVRMVRAVTIRRPASELYAFWRGFENLTRIVKHPVVITTTSPTESHWSITGPAGRRIEWDAVVTRDEPDRLIAWQSVEGADVPNRGSVRFEPAPGDEGTEVVVDLQYDPPGGKLGALLAKLTGTEGAQQVEDTLRRFKALLEAGEIPTIEGQPSGRARPTRRSRK